MNSTLQNPPPAVTGLCIRGTELCGLTNQGILPLYRFVPLYLALMCGEVVPFASDWPEYLKALLYLYSPLPSQPLTQIPAGLAPDLGKQSRKPSGLRPWEQATFRGWPLYLYLSDQPGKPVRGLRPDFFETVATTLHPLQGHPTEGPGYGP